MEDVFATVVYTLCFLTSTACAWLLARGYASSRARLLLWSSACFSLLAASNLMLVVDLLIFAEVDLRIFRLGLGATAVSVIIFGFVWDLEED